MINSKRFFFPGLLFFFSMLLVAACATNRSKESSVNYSDERSIVYEIEQTRKVMATDPLEALVRARSLKENTRGSAQIDTLYSEAEKKTRTQFDAAVSSGRWNDAISLFRSLDALALSPSGWNVDAINTKRIGVWKKEGNKVLAELDTIVPPTPGDEAPPSVIVSRMMKGTVTVWVDRGLRIENGIGYADRIIGSGFFIDSRGYFVTNYHVIASEVDPKYEGYSRLYIKLASDPDTRIPAKVIGWDPVFDLALIKTEIEPPAVFQLGTSEDLSVGNRIYAIGSPAGLDQTLTSGIVSAQKRRFLSLGDVLQIDAPINHGNSGGPIVDEAGRVQAVVFAGIEPYEGLNFAIPVELLRLILPALYDGGKVIHPWIGALGKSVALPGSAQNEGVSLLYALPGSPCQIAGIPTDTIITAVNGKRVKTLEELQWMIMREQSRTIIRLTGITAESAKKVPVFRDWFVMLSDRPQVPGEIILDKDLESRALFPLLGMKLEKVGSFNKYTVSSIIRGSIADETGFSEQDVIEIRNVKIDKENGTVAIQLFTKKRKSGYLDSYIGLTASLDSPSYF